MGSDRGVCVLGVSVRGVHVQRGSVLSPSGFCVRGDAKRGYIEGRVLSHGLILTQRAEWLSD